MNSAPPLRIVVAGTGKVGAAVIRGLLVRPELTLAGGVVYDPGKVGDDLGRLCGAAEVGIPAAHWPELPTVLAEARADVLCYCGLGESSNLADLSRAVDAGVDVVSVAGPTHFETAFGPERTAELARRALASGSRLVATGVNPGFLLDVLPVICASMTVAPERIYARRVSELGTWGSGVLDAFGIGRAAEDWHEAPHVSLAESLALASDALRIDLDRIEEQFEPHSATVRKEHADRVVEPGTIDGFTLTCRGVARGAALIELEWIGLVGVDPDDPDLADPHRVVISGGQLECRVSGDAVHDPYPATAARAINAIAPLRTLPPGLYSPAQLPIAA